jgi:hypothetical protein
MPSARRSHVGLGSRRSTYTLITGVVIGMLAAGLGIPFIFGTPLHSANQGNTNALGTGASGSSAAASAGAGTAGEGATTTTPLSGAAGIVGGGVSGTGGGGAAAGAGLAANAPGGGASTGPSGVALTASDRGVTASTITVAFALADLGGVSKVGFSVPGFDPKQQAAYDQTFVDNANAHGGIFGRKIVPVYVKYDPLEESTEDAACLAATQDHTIFAAVDSGGGLSFAAQLCFTQQNHTPLIELGSFGTTQDMYRQSAGNLFTVESSGVRSLANMAYTLVSSGALKGKHIGIVDRDFPGTVQTVTDGMVNTLKQFGYDVTYRADMSSDDGTATSQVPVAAQTMRRHGVDAVMLLTDFITGSEFAQSADRSAYTPEYFMSDFESETNDTAVSAMPSSFRAVGVTTMRTGEWRVGLPEPAVDAACRQVYESATGSKLQRSDNAYAATLEACDLVDLLVRGMRGSGPTLTRAGFSAGMQQIGTLAMPYLGGGSFRPGKFDGADLIRTLNYQQSCTCWMPVGSFVPPRY